MHVFNFQERGGLTSLLNKAFCALVENYLKKPDVFFTEIIIGGLFTNRGLVNEKNHNLYPDILRTNPSAFVPYMTPPAPISFDVMGLQHLHNAISNPTIQMLLETYFNISDTVLVEARRIMQMYSLQPEKSVFVWARGTDKVTECDMPSDADYHTEISKYINGHNIYVQTDDMRIEQTFATTTHSTIFDELPRSESALGFHHSIGCLPEPEFFKKCGLSKVEYNVRMMALLYIASQCDVVIAPPGNIQSFIALLRRNTKNMYTPNCSIKKTIAHMRPAQPLLLPGSRRYKVLYDGPIADNVYVNYLLSDTIPSDIDIFFIGASNDADPELFRRLMRLSQTTEHTHYFGVPYGQEVLDMEVSFNLIIHAHETRSIEHLLSEMRATIQCMALQKNKYSFTARVWLWPGLAGWHFVNVPKDFFMKIRNTKQGIRKGLLPIDVRVGRTTWRTSLLPDTKSGTYLISIKKSVRKAESILAGDEIFVNFNVL